MRKIEDDRLLISRLYEALNDKYDLHEKTKREPGVKEIIEQMIGRLENAFGSLSSVKDKRIFRYRVWVEFKPCTLIRFY
jgi:hypothetical protein